MTAKKFWIRKARRTFAHIAEERKPHEIVSLGMRLTVLPDVFSPKYFTDSEWFAKQSTKIIKKGRVLEVGVGTGIIATYLARHGAAVFGTDINPAAVKNTRLNFKKYGVKGWVREGSTLKPLRKTEKFDYIFWNHPFNYAPTKPETLLLRAGLDYKYEGLQEFLKLGKQHLRPGGQLLLGTGNIARIMEIKKLARKYGYAQKLLAKGVVTFDQASSTAIDLRIYSFTPTP